MSDATAAYRAARDWLLDTTRSYEDTVAEFRFPEMPDPFNWVSDWFDVVADGNDERALVVVEEDGSSTAHTFAELRARSLGVSAWLAGLGVRRGDSVIVMLGNRVELWESMLGIMRLGAVVMPTTTAVGPAELVDRIERGAARHVIVDAADTGKFVDVPGDYTRISVGPTDGETGGWHTFADGYDADPAGVGHAGTAPGDRLLLYFTSGTTAQPKLVEHTQASYPVGHLSTMYWLGSAGRRPRTSTSRRPAGPSTRGRASSRRGSPAATIVRAATTRASTPARCSTLIDRVGVTTFCAPPTVWRMLDQSGIRWAATGWRCASCVGAGEPLEPGGDRAGCSSHGGSRSVTDTGRPRRRPQIGNPPARAAEARVRWAAPLPGYQVAAGRPRDRRGRGGRRRALP